MHQRFEIGAQPRHESVLATPSRVLRAAGRARKVGAVGITTEIDIASRGMDRQRPANVAHTTAQVGGLHQRFEISAQPRHESVVVAAAAALRAAGRARKVGACSATTKIDFTTGGMNCQGIAVVVPATAQIDGLVEGLEIGAQPRHESVLATPSRVLRAAGCARKVGAIGETTKIDLTAGGMDRQRPANIAPTTP